MREKYRFLKSIYSKFILLNLIKISEKFIHYLFFITFKKSIKNILIQMIYHFEILLLILL